MKKDEILSAIGIFFGIGIVALVSKSIDTNLLLAPFGATSIIAFLLYDSEYAQPRNIILGYIITSIVGILMAYILGHNWIVYALGVAIAMLVKSWFKAIHPPSAAMPIILLKANEQGIINYFLFDVIPGICLLVFIAIVYNRFILHRDYPLWHR